MKFKIQSDIPCRVQAVHSCFTPYFNATTWPGKPRGLKAVSEKDGAERIANFTWHLPYDASYRQIKGFLLEFTIIGDGLTSQHPYCYLYNLSSTNWNRIDNPHDITFKFDCFRFDRPARVFMKIFSTPFPALNYQYSEVFLKIKGVEREDPCSLWNQNLKWDIMDIRYGKADLNISFNSYENAAGDLHSHKLLLVDVCNGPRDVYVTEHYNILLPNTSVLFTDIPLNHTYRIDLRPMRRAGFMIDRYCKTAEFRLLDEVSVTSGFTSLDERQPVHYVAPVAIVLTLITVTSIITAVVILWRRGIIKCRKTQENLNRDTESGNNNSAPLLTDPYKHTVDKRGVLIVCGSENAVFDHAVDALVALIRKFTDVEVTFYRELNEQLAIRSSMSQWATEKVKTHSLLFVIHEGLCVLYNAHAWNERCPKYTNLYTDLVLKVLDAAKDSILAGYHDKPTFVKLCLHGGFMINRNSPVGEFMGGPQFVLSCLNTLGEDILVEFNDNELKKFLVHLSGYSEISDFNIDIEECKLSPEGKNLRDCIQDLVFAAKNDPM